MYSHTQATVIVQASGGGSTDNAVHELRGQVAALQQELQERAKEQMEWLHEMDGMRRLLQVTSFRFCFCAWADCEWCRRGMQLRPRIASRWTKFHGCTRRAAK
jgi:hypothetical protein